MKKTLFQEHDYLYKGETFVIKIFRTSTGLEARSYWKEKEFPEGSVQMSADIEDRLRESGKFDIVFKNADHLGGLIKMIEEHIRIRYDHRHLFE